MPDVMLIYFLIITSALVVAGLILATLTFVAKKNVTSIWATYRSWMLMIPPAFLCIFFGRVSTVLMVITLALLAIWEFAKATGLSSDKAITTSLWLLAIFTGCTALMTDPYRLIDGWFPLFLAMPVYAITALLLIPVILNRAKGQLESVSLSIVGYLYLGWMFMHLAHLANIPERSPGPSSEGFILFLIFSVAVSDIVAFVVGKLFGRHKLRSEISPNKTWEGAIGAFLVAMVLPWILAFSFPEDFGPIQKILAGIIVGIGGQLGDLAISVFKRDLKLKDMGSSIPGHGGVLDRIDSLIFAAPLYVHMLNYYDFLS